MEQAEMDRIVGETIREWRRAKTDLACVEYRLWKYTEALTDLASALSGITGQRLTPAIWADETAIKAANALPAKEEIIRMLELYAKLSKTFARLTETKEDLCK